MGHFFFNKFAKNTHNKSNKWFRMSHIPNDFKTKTISKEQKKKKMKTSTNLLNRHQNINKFISVWWGILVSNVKQGRSTIITHTNTHMRTYTYTYTHKSRCRCTRTPIPTLFSFYLFTQWFSINRRKTFSTAIECLFW